MIRRLGGVAVIGGALPWMVAPAFAHGGGRAFVLLMPTGYYLAGGTLAVAATFLLLAVIPRGLSDRLGCARLPLLALKPPSPVATSLLSALLLGFLLATGLYGSRDPLANPLPLTIWTLWWVGFTLATAMLGDLWAYVNPWTGPYRLAMWLGSKLSEASTAAPPPHNAEGGSVGTLHKPPLCYPSWLGYWPAIVLFLGFAWFELIDVAPDDPERLAVAVAAYWLFTFIAVLLFGEEAWLGRAEPFSLFFRLIGGLAPLVWTPDPDDGSRQRLALALPGSALSERCAALPPSGVLFILLTLSSVTFDGLSKTFWWLGLNGINPLEFPGRSGVLGLNTLGLLLTWEALAVLYTGAVLAGWWLAGRPGSPRALLGTLVLSIMPISLGFHFSHYLTALFVNGQYAWLAAADPFGLSQGVLAMGASEVTTSFLNTYEGTRAIWNAQTAGIVTGHVLAVLLAHELVRRVIGDEQAAVLSQLPLAAVMVGYTWLGLWLLSTPVAG
ncbi:MAG TPA: hypothetical protein VFY92_10315 [Hyphomicrobiaceae bacterium]|nr:hypothetical protein [Hyphomicrobiaceae bacterium]